MRVEFFTEKRGYLLILERDLLGHFVLFRRWYGLRNRRWGAKREVFLSKEDAIKKIDQITKLRMRHGYRTNSESGLDSDTLPSVHH